MSYVLKEGMDGRKLAALVLDERSQKLYFVDSCELKFGYTVSRYETMVWEANERTQKPKNWAKPVIELRFSNPESMKAEHRHVCDDIGRYLRA